MAINGSVEIKVTPEVLDQKAGEVTGYINAMQRAFDTVKRTVGETRNYWVGEAGDHHRQLFQNQEGDIAAILERLKEHPVDLRKIAGTYKETEKKEQEYSGAVPNDLIS